MRILLSTLLLLMIGVQVNVVEDMLLDESVYNLVRMLPDGLLVSSWVALRIESVLRRSSQTHLRVRDHVLELLSHVEAAFKQVSKGKDLRELSFLTKVVRSGHSTYLSQRIAVRVFWCLTIASMVCWIVNSVFNTTSFWL